MDMTEVTTETPLVPCRILSVRPVLEDGDRNRYAGRLNSEVRDGLFAILAKNEDCAGADA